MHSRNTRIIDNLEMVSHLSPIVAILRLWDSCYPVTRFEGKVLAHSANSIAVSKDTLDDGIKYNSEAKKSDRSRKNGDDTTTGFLE